MNTIKDITNYLETIAPLQLQESYDNCGLIVGNSATKVKGITICLDSTEEVVLEAKRNGHNLVIAHHPIVFSGLKKFNGKNYVEKAIMTAIKNDIAIYAAHTNMDNIIDGVNRMIAEKLGLVNLRILAPKKHLLRKLIVYCPMEHAEKVRMALFGAGAGNIGNYDQCSFSSTGKGTFRPGTMSDPFIGKKGHLSKVDEEKIEVLYESFREMSVLNALIAAHPYEEIAYDIFNLENHSSGVGSGIVGELPEKLTEMNFLKLIKKKMKAGMVRYTPLTGRQVNRVAICGGSGSFLLNDALSADAQMFITSDFKYHQFFDANGKIVIADIGHYESEQYTMELFKSLILKKFPKFAVRLTEVNTNPVQYL